MLGRDALSLLCCSAVMGAGVLPGGADHSRTDRIVTCGPSPAVLPRGSYSPLIWTAARTRASSSTVLALQRSRRTSVS